MVNFAKLKSYDRNEMYLFGSDQTIKNVCPIMFFAFLERKLLRKKKKILNRFK